MTESSNIHHPHHFSRVFGRPPTPRELERRPRGRLTDQLPALVKRRAALLITRL